MTGASFLPVDRKTFPLMHSLDTVVLNTIADEGRLDALYLCDVELSDLMAELRANGAMSADAMQLEPIILMRMVKAHGMSYRGVPLRVSTLLR